MRLPLICVFLLFISLSSVAFATCITDTEVNTINNISLATNTSNSTLQNMFEESCLYNQQIDLINSNISDMYNKNITDTKLLDIENWVISETSVLVEAELNQTNVSTLVDAYLWNLTERIDTQLFNLKNTSVSREVFDREMYNLNASMNNQWYSFQEQRQVPGYFPYIFLMIIVIFVGYIYYLKTIKHPYQKHKITEGWKDTMAKLGNIQDKITNADTKKQIKIQTELKEIVNASKLDVREKYKVMSMITDGILEDKEEVNQEIKNYLEEAEKPKKRKRASKKKKKEVK